MIKLVIYTAIFLIFVSLGSIYLPKETQKEISIVAKEASKEVGHHVSNGLKIVKNVLANP